MFQPLPRRPARRPEHPSRLVAVSLLLALASLHGAAGAATADRKQPVDVSANDIDGSLADDGESILRGAVHITQGSLEIQSGVARVTRVGGELSRVMLEGEPATLKQLDDQGKVINAKAREIIFQPAEDQIELRGGVVIEQPQGNLTGERITYHLGTGRIQADGQGGRVSMRMNPKPAKTDSGAQ